MSGDSAGRPGPPAAAAPGTERATGREEFPQAQARTRRFTLGAPRDLRVSGDGRRVLFLRALGSTDPTTALWALDLDTGTERCLLDPRDLPADASDLPAAERARRERAREAAEGVVRYALDGEGSLAVAAVGPHAAVVEVASGRAYLPSLPGPVTDPRLDPTGQRLAWVREGELMVSHSDGDDASVLLSDPDKPVTWGLAEFIAAEETGRTRGFWWAPDGSGLLAARVDTSPVATWHLADPAQPWLVPQTIRYPAAGATNAEVSLGLVDLEGAVTPVEWDRERLPYLARVDWSHDPPLLAVQTRDQRLVQLLDVDTISGATRVRSELTDPHWVELCDGLPRRLPDGRALAWRDVDDVRRLCIDEVPIGPPDLHVRGLVDVVDGAALVSTAEDDPTARPLWWVPLDDGEAHRLTPRDGIHTGAAAHGTTVVARATLESTRTTVTAERGGSRQPITNHAAAPPLEPAVRLLRLGRRDLRAALLLPHGHAPGDGALPVLLDPYGGPHAQRVLQSGSAFGTSQWFAEHGYAVLVVDGRGTPGRGAAWERTVAGDLAGPVLTDQLDALDAAAQALPGTLDLTRVGIRGWSFGGYLAALAVLERPDRVHAAVAGAPVTDWRWYDTHYTERYLGTDPDAEAYRRCSLVERASALRRPLLLVHGLADDNVVAAHSLQLSAALLAAGRPHRMLPLTGVTHMTPQEEIAEHLLLLQRDFLDEALSG